MSAPVDVLAVINDAQKTMRFIDRTGMVPSRMRDESKQLGDARVAVA